jgi:hypothetical protein
MPDQSEWKTVWLGTADTPEADGWLPTSEVSYASLAVFDQKVTIGDATKDTDPFISSWIQGDFSGGGQIEIINEGSDTNRFWWGIADTRFPNHVTLPPLVESFTKSPQVVYRPLGDAFVVAGGRTAMAFSVWNGGVYSVVLFNEATKTFGALSAVKPWQHPGNYGAQNAVSFRGDNAAPLLYVPQDTHGYYTVRDNGSFVPTVQLAYASSMVDDIPAVRAFAVFNNNLMAIDVEGQLWRNVAGGSDTWERLKLVTGGPLRVDRADEPRGLLSFFNRNGDPTLLVYTNRGLYMWDQNAGTLESTTISNMDHPEFGRHAIVFRPGEDLWINVAEGAIRFTNASVIVPGSGLDRDDGLPGVFRSTTAGYGSTPSYLFSATQGDIDDLSSYNTISCWTGTGWHGLWEGSTQDELFPPVISTANDSSTDTPSYRLWWGTTVAAHSIELPQDFHNPRQGRIVGVDSFAESGYIESGRFDAAMLGFHKLASHVAVACDYASATETVTVSYTTDMDLAADPDDPTWHTLGTATAPGITSFGFDPDEDGFPEGTHFDWIRLRVDLARGVNAAQTPVVTAWTLHYTKIPHNAASFSFKVPLPLDTWMGRTGKEIATHLDSLLTADVFCKFVHQGKTYRARVAGVSGVDYTGEDTSGVRQVTLMEIDDQVRSF